MSTDCTVDATVSKESQGWARIAHPLAGVKTADSGFSRHPVTTQFVK